MALRWYTSVINCTDVAAQARWWAEALDWQIWFEAEDEAVIAPRWYTELEKSLPFERMPPALVFVPVTEAKTVKNRIHLDLAPHTSQDREAEIQRLLDLGATPVDVGQGPDVTWTVLADPEGNEFCVLSSRDD
jgi:hypothetical protein